MPSDITKLLNIIQKNAVMRASELAPLVSTRTALRRYAEAGSLLSLGAGLYAHPSLDPFAASVIAVARYYPQAVISNVTALVIHGLSDERVNFIDVDIPRQRSIQNKLMNVHRVAQERIVGVSKQPFFGFDIRIYTCERALCEAYHIDPEGPLLLKAIKRYVKDKNIDTETIREFDKILRTNVLRSLTQELADG